MNSHVTVAFDVDGTLIHQVGEREDTPRYDMITLFKMFQNLGCQMYVWSGSGVDYAKRWCERLGLDAEVVGKGSFIPALAFDDAETDLAKIDIRV